jgi:hypothetical protein
VLQADHSFERQKSAAHQVLPPRSSSQLMISAGDLVAECPVNCPEP